MSRSVYEIIGGILIFVSSYVSEQMPRRWRIALWIVFGAMAIGYSSLGIYLDKITEREQRRKDADNEQALIELKSQIRTLVRAEPMDTSNIRQDLLILEAELQHTISGKPYQMPPVPMRRPGIVADFSTPIAVSPKMRVTSSLTTPTTLAAPNAIRLTLFSVSDVATPTSFRITCNTEIYEASFFVAGQSGIRHAKSGFSPDRKTYFFSYEGPPFSNGLNPPVVTISATSPLKVERVEQLGSVSTVPNL